MNILMISPFDLVTTRLWGPTIRLHSLAKELARSGHKVTLAGPPPFSGPRPDTLDTVPLYYFRRPFHRYPYPNDDGQKQRERNNLRRFLPLVLGSRFLEIFRLLGELKIDVMIINRTFLDTAYPAYLARLIRRVSYVCDWDDLEGMHGFSTSFRAPLHLQLFETFNEVVFPRFAGATVVASRYLFEFAGKIGIKANRLFYAPSVADSEHFHPSVSGEEVRKKYGLTKDNKVLMYCGNLMRGNGVRVENILFMLAHLLKHDQSYRLLVVGAGDLITRRGGRGGLLVRLSRRLGIQDKVIFTGGVPYQEVPQHIAASDLCLALFPINVVTLSKSPLKVYEYMAAGKPVAARAVGDIAECVQDGVTGIHVYSEDPLEYADKVHEIFSRPGLLSKMGEAARRRIDALYLWKHSAAVTEEACNVALVFNKKGT